MHIVYYNFDNMDGKQARRTGTSSALGMLVDHQVDSLVDVMQTTNMALILQFDSFPKDLLVLCAATMPFFLTTLESYYTGSLSMPKLNAANEGNVAIAFFFLAGGLFGTDIYQTYICTVLGQTIRLSEIFLYLATLIILCNTLFNYWQIYKTGNLMNAFSKSLVFFYMTFSLALLLVVSPSGVLTRYMRLAFIIYGCNFAKLCGCL